MMRKTRQETTRLVGIALFTALVVMLQLLGSFIRFGPFSISLVLLPIVIGAAVYGVKAGGWLGFVFGLAVILSGDAAAFFAISVPGTVITVLAKGILAGLGAGMVYKLLEKQNATLGVFAAAAVCPIINSGVFALGCRVFFFETLATWAVGEGYGDDVWGYLILGMIGLNFVMEFVVNLILSPAVVTLIQIGRKSLGKQSGDHQ